MVKIHNPDILPNDLQMEMLPMAHPCPVTIFSNAIYLPPYIKGIQRAWEDGLM